jgi:2-polyprenyl-3-methyl-5-hydroxy-6-metoxy-1,4-benzoquinol methylase
MLTSHVRQPEATADTSLLPCCAPDRTGAPGTVRLPGNHPAESCSTTTKHPAHGVRLHAIATLELLARCGEFSDGLLVGELRVMINVAWDHNTYYHARLLRALPPPCRRVLDVGCGAGELAARLAERADQVDALDQSAVMISEARRTVPANVTCLLGDAAVVDLPAGAYDAITSVSALHHMDLPVVLPRLAAALKPGGLLIAIALHRLQIPRGLPGEAASVIGGNARRAALLWLPAGRRARREMRRRLAGRPPMPVMEPDLTIHEVRAQAAAALPGARVRWLVHWRYELTWRKPRG